MHRDFKELLSAFNEGHVKYLVVGAYAVSMHAAPRATKDLDILVGADAENSEAVYAALAKFGAPVEGLTAKDFTGSCSRSGSRVSFAWRFASRGLSKTISSSPMPILAMDASDKSGAM